MELVLGVSEWRLIESVLGNAWASVTARRDALPDYGPPLDIEAANSLAEAARALSLMKSNAAIALASAILPPRGVRTADGEPGCAFVYAAFPTLHLWLGAAVYMAEAGDRYDDLLSLFLKVKRHVLALHGEE